LLAVRAAYPDRHHAVQAGDELAAVAALGVPQAARIAISPYWTTSDSTVLQRHLLADVAGVCLDPVLFADAVAPGAGDAAAVGDQLVQCVEAMAAPNCSSVAALMVSPVLFW
jgi:hypothetical protein